MSDGKHKNHNHSGNKQFKPKEEHKTEENQEELKHYYEEPAEDLSPPQDLNLKLQIEKENSIALTNMLKTLQADFENFRKRNGKKI